MLIFLLFTSITVAENETVHLDEHNPRIFDPPPREHLADSRLCRQEWWMKNDSTFSCFGAKFVTSDGFFQPCNQHSHCYESREPTDWCILAYGYRWSNWGCHCDKKFNSCVIERWNGYGRQMEWGYCTPKKEFHCDPEQMKRKERVDAYLMRMKG